MSEQKFIQFARENAGIPTTTTESYIKNFRAMTPNVIETRDVRGLLAIDIFSRIMMDRIIFLSMPINDTVANIINAQLLFLESEDDSRDIHMYINSPGGTVYDGLAMVDVMEYIKPEISTLCVGIAASMAAVLLSCGQKGKRFALRRSRVMIHQPLGGAQGQASDIEIMFNEMKELQKDLYEILAENTGQTYETIQNDCDRDNWMRASKALEYGLIDEIISKRPE